MYDNAIKCGNCQKYNIETNDIAIGSEMNDDHSSVDIDIRGDEDVVVDDTTSSAFDIDDDDNDNDSVCKICLAAVYPINGGIAPTSAPIHVL